MSVRVLCRGGSFKSKCRQLPASGDLRSVVPSKATGSWSPFGCIKCPHVATTEENPTDTPFRAASLPSISPFRCPPLLSPLHSFPTTRTTSTPPHPAPSSFLFSLSLHCEHTLFTFLRCRKELGVRAGGHLAQHHPLPPVSSSTPRCLALFLSFPFVPFLRFFFFFFFFFCSFFFCSFFLIC